MDSSYLVIMVVASVVSFFVALGVGAAVTGADAYSNLPGKAWVIAIVTGAMFTAAGLAYMFFTLGTSDTYYKRDLSRDDLQSIYEMVASESVLKDNVTVRSEDGLYSIEFHMQARYEHKAARLIRSLGIGLVSDKDDVDRKTYKEPWFRVEGL